MRVSPIKSATHPLSRLLLVLALIFAWCRVVPPASAQIDQTINTKVWEMYYGLNPNQIQASWLTNQLPAGTNPLLPNSQLQVATFSATPVTAPTTISLTFPTVATKLYTAEATTFLNPMNWQPVAGASVVGDGTSKTLTFAKNGKSFFHVVVGDQSTANDGISDWAKQILGYTPGTSIFSQTGYSNLTQIDNAITAQNVVSVSVGIPSATQPGDAATPASGSGVITFTRAGFQSFNAITVPITVTGSAAAGTDFTALPSSVTFAAGVNSVSLNVTPLFNANRFNSSTVTVTAQPGGGYSLGSPASGSVTIYPAANASGTGLTGNYYLGSNAAYTNTGALGAAVVTYNYTKNTSTSGSATITLGGTPAVPYIAGSTAILTFASGNLSGGLYNGSYTVTFAAGRTIQVAITGAAVPLSGTGNASLTSYNYTQTSATGGTAVISYIGAPASPYTVGGTVNLAFLSGNLLPTGSLFNGNYVVTAVGPGTLTVAISGGAVPASGVGNVTLLPFAPATNNGNFGGLLVNYNFSSSGGTGNAVLNYTGTPSVPFTVGSTVNVQFTSGNLSGAGFDAAYPITAVSGGAGSGSVTVTLTGSSLPGTGSGAATLSPFTAPVLSRLDPGVDFLWNTGVPSNTSLQTATNNNWAARYDSYLVPPTTGNYKFDVQASDGARVYVNGTLIIDAWMPGASTNTPVASANVALTAATPVPIRVEYYHLNSVASLNLRWLTPGAGSFAGIPSTNTFFDAALTINAWTGTYWTNIGGNTAPTTFTAFYGLPRYGDYPTALTNLTWTSQPTGTLPSTDNFSIRWDGYLKPTSTGTYTFDVQASDGARVYLDVDQNGTFVPAETIIDAWTPADGASVTPAASTSYSLTAGQLYKFRVEYYEGTVNALVLLRWNLNGGSMTPIPAANVFRADPLTGAATATTGLWASYYQNATLLDPPVYSAQDTSGNTITFNYALGKPGTSSLGSGANNNWAGRFDTYLLPPGTGNFQFQLVANTAGRLVVNGTEIIPFTAGTSTSGPVALTTGTTVPLRVEFYDTGSNGSAVLSYAVAGPTPAYTTIPTSQFFLDAAATQPGVAGTYWTNSAFIGAASFADYQTQINYNVGGGQPSKTLTATDFSATWDGYLLTTSAGAYVFDLLADNKARVYINGVLAMDAWTTPGSAAVTPVQSSPITLAASTRYPIHVDYENTSGPAYINVRWQPPGSPILSAISNIWFLRDATSSQYGLLATYYPNPTLTPPFAYQVAENNSPGLTYNFGAGSPDTSIPNTNFTARWTGQVLPQYTEPYWFTVKSDDGARLWVNGQLLIDKWQTQGTTEWTSYPINLQAGVYYDIKLEYLQINGNAEVHLNWYSNDQPKQIIPTARLFPAITGVAQSVPPGVTSPPGDVYVTGSGSPYTYTIGGSNSPSTYSVTGLPPGLTLNGNVISGTPTQPGVYQFTITTTNASGSTSVTVTLTVLGNAGKITRELWAGLSGPNISDIPLLSTTQLPTSDSTLTTLEDTATYANNTGERLRGYFTAPATGNYYFWVAASNAAELWISNSSEPVANVRRAYVSGPTGSAARTWNTQSNQKSPWLALTGGQKYYFEVLHNTGGSGASSNLSVGWYLDPTGNALNPVANGAGPASAATGGLVPTYVLSPWDNPPTTNTAGTVYVADLAGVSGTNSTANGGAFLRVDSGNTAVIHLNYAGLTSGVTFRRIYKSNGASAPTLLFDLDNQDKNYSNLKTTDSGYTWSGADVASLNSGLVYLSIGTTQNPVGELVGSFGKTSGSQKAPALPSYSSPSWTDDHATSLTSNSRFLTQATFGPSPSDMTYLHANSYRTWIENQFATTATHNVPYVLANLTNSPQDPYDSSIMFNSWWKNSVTAPDQLRQRIAFALSEIMVVSDAGPLNTNGRVLADYYDTLLDYGFDNFRNLLKQVSLSSAMGLYLNMQGNDLANLSSGLHPNENYAREIMQLFSLGLYRLWPDGSLILDSNGNAIPTYDQTVITGLARVFTGWTYGQSLSAGRLPTNFFPAGNFLDPMVLVPTHHELGSKILLDNVMLPPAVVTVQTDTSADPNPNPITIQSTDAILGQGNLVSTPITSTYDLNGLRDLEATLDSIFYNSSVGPFICRQLIQRLVTSNPKPEYVYRVVRAFNGERNIDGVTTGVRGDMKDVIRAILLDPEARSATEAADPGFGKQREPLLRITGPARAFPATSLTGCSYRQSGGQYMLITTPSAHRLVNGDTVFLDFSADTSSTAPTSTAYSVGNTTPSYTIAAGGVVTVTFSANQQLYKAGDPITLQFISGSPSLNSTYNVPAVYTVNTTPAPTSTTFTFTIANTTFTGASGNILMPNNFTVAIGNFTTPAYTISGSTVTFTAGASTGLLVGDKVFVKFTTGSAATGAFDKVYIIGSGYTITLSGSPGSTGGNVLIPKFSGGYSIVNSGNVSALTIYSTGNNNLNVGDQVWIDILAPNLPLPAPSGLYTVTALPGTNLFTVLTTSQVTQGTQAGAGMVAYPLVNNSWTRSGTGSGSTNLALNYGTWSVNYTTGSVTYNLNQTPLDAPTVFNYFYPSYQYAGPVSVAPTTTPTFPLLAQAGMTTPEFQLTNDSDTMTLTNYIAAGILNVGNTYGIDSFPGGGNNSGAVPMDMSAYMTSAQTQNPAIPTTVHNIAVVLAGGNVTSASETTISNYVTANVNATITSISTGTGSCTVTSANHGLTSGNSVTISGVTGGVFTPASPGVNSTYTVTVTGPNTFTIPLTCNTSPSAAQLTNAIFTSSTLSNTLMRDRIRAIVHLIISCAEYAIQK